MGRWLGLQLDGWNGPRAVGQCQATKPSFDDEQLHGMAQRHAQSYSVRNKFAHGPDPATVWRATQGGVGFHG